MTTNSTVTESIDQKQKLTEQLAFVRDFEQREMPRINSSAEGGDFSGIPKIINWIQVITISLNLGELDLEDARNLITHLGFLISSIERHSQANGQKPGASLANLIGLEDIMIALGKIAKHPPRDSLYTFALWNTPETITFTGDPQEMLFIDVVRNSTNILYRLHRKVSQLTKKPVILEETTVDVLEEIITELNKARKEFLRFYEKDEQGEKKFTPEFFANRMRHYNCTWQIQGQSYSGPTAANCVPWMALDFLLGLSDEGYIKHCEQRYINMTHEDQEILREAMITTDLPSRISQEWKIRSVLSEDRHIEIASIQMKKIILKMIEVQKAMASLTAMHWGLIQNFLAKPMKNTSIHEGSGPMNPQYGTSGMSFSDVEKIMNMRRFADKYELLKGLILSQKVAI